MKKLNLINFLFVVLAFGAVSTFAQDDSEPWTGFYVGGYVGVANARPSVNTSTIYSDSGYFSDSSVPAINTAGARHFSNSGFTGGGQVGYNKQFGRFVIGAEADFGAQNISGDDSVTVTYPCCAPDTFTIDQVVESKWLFTARPRVGVTAGKALFYATGGVAVTDVQYSALFTDTDSNALEFADFDNTRTGYTAGGGVEVKVSKRWSVKGEYLFSDFGRESVTSNNLTTEFFGGKELLGVGGETEWPENTFTHSARLKTHSVRFGVNYRF